MVGDINPDGADETARLIDGRGGVARSAVVDVSDEAQVERFVAAAVARARPARLCSERRRGGTMG